VSEQVLHILRGEAFQNAVNMPPIPPAVRAKLEPYFELGTKLGSFLAQLADGAITEVQVSYSGDLSDVDTTPLTRYILTGILSHHLDKEQVNIVSSFHLAKMRGIEVITQKSTAAKGFTNLITVTIRTRDGQHSAAGTLLNGYGARIVQIDPYPVDIPPEGHLLLISHTDKPGIIGRVGTLLGVNDVNIATMQVGRKVVGGSAIMVLTIDKPAPKAVIDELKKLADLTDAIEITL